MGSVPSVVYRSSAAGSVPAMLPTIVTINEPSNVPLGTENSISLSGVSGVSGESVVSDESITGVVPSSLAVVVVSPLLLTDALSEGLSDVPGVSGMVDGPGSGSVTVGGAEDCGVGAGVTSEVFVGVPALGVTEGTMLGAGSPLPLGAEDCDEQPKASPRPETDKSNTDGKNDFIRVPERRRSDFTQRNTIVTESTYPGHTAREKARRSRRGDSTNGRTHLTVPFRCDNGLVEDPVLLFDRCRVSPTAHTCGVGDAKYQLQVERTQRLWVATRSRRLRSVFEERRRLIEVGPARHLQAQDERPLHERHLPQRRRDEWHIVRGCRRAKALGSARART